MALLKRFNGDVSINFEGEWLKLGTLIDNQHHMISKAAIQGQLNAAKEYKRLLKSNIRTGGMRFHYPPLSTEYSKKKGSSKMFTYTHSLYNAIDIFISRSGRVSVGVPDGITRTGGRPTNLEVGEYARILEGGNSKQKARPIFSDTFHQFGGKWAIGLEVRKQLYIVYSLFNIKLK